MIYEKRGVPDMAEQRLLFGGGSQRPYETIPASDRNPVLLATGQKTEYDRPAGGSTRSRRRFRPLTMSGNILRYQAGALRILVPLTGIRSAVRDPARWIDFSEHDSSCGSRLYDV